MGCRDKRIRSAELVDDMVTMPTMDNVTGSADFSEVVGSVGH